MIRAASMGLLLSLLAACGDDTSASSSSGGGGGATPSGSGEATPTSAGNTTGTGGSDPGSGGAGGAGCVQACGAPDATVETCPAGLSCYELSDCEVVVVCVEGACVDASDDAPCDEALLGAHCTEPAGDCDHLLRCDDADGGPTWVFEDSVNCSEG